MAYTRTLDAQTPPAARDAEWLARALLEAPSPDGPWTPIQATTSLHGPITSELAQHETGWYRIQWHDSNRANRFSDPVQMSGHIAQAGDTARREAGRR